MFGQILPGFRDIRAPLIAGYAWFAALFLLFSGRFAHSGSEARATFTEAYDLADFVGRVGVGLALSFACYIVGSLTLSLVEAVMNRAAKRAVALYVRDIVVSTAATDNPGGNGTGPRWYVKAAMWPVTRARQWRDAAVKLASPNYIPISSDVMVRVADRIGARAEKLYAAEQGPIHAAFTDADLVASVHPKHDLHKILAEHPKGAAEDSADYQNRLREVIEATLADADHKNLLVDTTKRKVAEEIAVGNLQDRLLVDHQQLYGEYDRLIGEQELRDAVTLPTIVLTIAVLVTSDLSIYLEATLLSLTAMVLIGIFRQARSREKQAGDIVANAVIEGHIKTPTLELLGEPVVENGHGEPEAPHKTNGA